MLKIIRLLVICLLLIESYAFAAIEDLDEVINRTSRQAAINFSEEGKDAVEDSSDNYKWQPETLCYTEVTYGNEVWRVTGSYDINNWTQDISWAQYSADGKYLSIKSTRDTDGHSSPYYASYGNWFIQKTDGTILRPIITTPARSAVKYNYFHWSPVEPNIYYAFGRYSYPGEINLTKTTLYQITVTDDSESYSEYITGFNSLGSGNDDLYNIKKGFSSDGTKMLWGGDPGTGARFYPVTVYPPADKGADVIDGYSIDLSWDEWWGQLDGYSGSYHDQYLTGAGSNIWNHIMPEGASGVWLRVKLSGTGVDEAPNFIQDQSTPYDWGGEADYLQTHFSNSREEGDCDYPTRDPWCCDNDPSTQCAKYLSHYTPDRWGEYGIFSNTDAGNPVFQSTGIWDIENKVYIIDHFTSLDIVGVQHSAWNAWSDWSISSTDSTYVDQRIAKQNYTDITSRTGLNKTYTASSGAYNRLPRPSQSPDGTKALWHGTFLNFDTANKRDLFYTVAYYPHAPEIDSVTTAGGVSTITVWWDLAGNNRGYSTRGWPDSLANDPPPPREIETFRLWRSADKITWIPIKTFNHDVWNKYEFSDGTWKSGTETTNKWSTTENINDGTYFYAVTSIETSGLESRSLSNIYGITISGGSGTGSQDTAYPIDPGGDSDFTDSYNEDIHRYYNIYAQDGSTPTISQTNRIASDSRMVKEFIDLLGDSGGSTRYIVTAVDTQGNESGALTSEFSFDAGQYTITWSDGIDTGDDLIDWTGSGIAEWTGTGTITWEGL